MASSKFVGWAGICLAVICFLAADVGSAEAQLMAGEYACAGASGILIGLGFKLRPDGFFDENPALDVPPAG